MSQPVLIVILGPTAIGKTALAIDVAKHFQTEIISADSRQIFRELNIGVARPSEEELAQVKHHFIATSSIHDQVSAGRFAEQARATLHDLFQQHEVVVCAGGSMLYLDAFIQGLDDLPGNPELRQQLMQEHQDKGMGWLNARLQELDPVYYDQVDLHNPHRVIRALEVCITSGQPFSTLRTSAHQPLPCRVVKIGIEAPREEMYQRINERVLNMMDQGLEEEARALLPHRELNALNTVGYQELFAYFDGAMSKQEAIERIQQHTRNFAKRQLTWWRRDDDIQWASSDQWRSRDWRLFIDTFRD
ncbi:MAG: tRNA (adenosine(37)-N6)-dimethylallyltransferase MiaA [Flavobacteriales bacterium]